jgi:hypothetical protein
MEWRPLSKRGQPDARLDEPHEGLPPHLLDPVLRWLVEQFQRAGYPLETELVKLQLRFRLDPPLDPRGPLDDLVHRCTENDEFALDVVDYALYHLPMLGSEYVSAGSRAVALRDLLVLGGSAWTVDLLDQEEGAFRLARRGVGPVPDAIGALSPSGRAHAHLVDAWNRSTSRDPDPSGAYREAVRAVEAAAKPVVLPSNDRATLGTMIAAMRDKPEKWHTTMGSVDDVRRQMEILWTSQLDRHGTDDEAVPLQVTQEQAEMAVHLSLLLTRMFVRGDIRVIEPDEEP